jgi:hypothetical protein
MNIRPIAAWYDFWVGLFWDAKKRRLYFFPVPCIGLVFDFGPEWIDGTTGNGLPGRKHWRTGEVQIMCNDHWTPTHNSWWPLFTPTPPAPKSSPV